MKNFRKNYLKNLEYRIIFCSRKGVGNLWKICTKKEYENKELIFPTQQNDVGTIVELWSINQSVEKIVIFGSSVTSACNPWSDIDVYVVLLEECHLRKPKLSVPIDLWTNFDVDDRLLAEINEKGVVVFERGDIT